MAWASPGPPVGAARAPLSRPGCLTAGMNRGCVLRLRTPNGAQTTPDAVVQHRYVWLHVSVEPHGYVLD